MAGARVTFSDGTFVGRMLMRGDGAGDVVGVGGAVGGGVGTAVGEAAADAVGRTVGDPAALRWLPAPHAVTSSRTVVLTRALMRPA